MRYLYSNQFYPAGPYQLFRQEAGTMIPGQYMGAAPGSPYMPLNGLTDVFSEERMSFEDARKLQSFYPRIAQEIQQHVEEECDKMEYEGSMMFDEYPDRIMLRKLTQDIYEKVKDFTPEEEAAQEPQELFSMDGRRRPPEDKNRLGDFIQVLLLDEMHRRRCRHRRCRNFW